MPTWAKWGQREPKVEKRVYKKRANRGWNKQVPEGDYMGQHGLKRANRVQLLSIGPTGANQTWKKYQIVSAVKNLNEQTSVQTSK